MAPDYATMTGLFGLSIAIVLSSGYLVYYLWARHVISTVSPTEARVGYRPNTAVVIATYNEEKMIRRKLQDLFNQTYPMRLTRILVVDGGSSDRTLQIVNSERDSHPDREIAIIAEGERRGKSHSVNLALRAVPADCELVVFTDAEVRLREDALERLVSHFEDDTIGGVSGTQVLTNPGKTFYTRMETAYRGVYATLRVAESRIDSTPIFHGDFAAFRSCLVRDERIPEDANADDSALAIMVRKKGWRVICDPEAVFYEMAPPDRESQDAQKTRRGQGLVRLFWRNRDVLLRPRYGVFGMWIFPANFGMHILSPPLFALSLFSMAIGALALALEVMNPVLLLAIAVFVVGMTASLGILKNSRNARPILALTTFALYQFFLLKAMVLSVARVKLYMWEIVQSVRN